MKPPRQKAIAKSKKNASQETPARAPSLPVLPPSSDTPPCLTILPRDLSSSARIISLPHPATAKPCRFLLDLEKRSCYEFSRTGAKGRSWMLAPSATESQHSEEVEEGLDQDRKNAENGSVLEKGELVIATPIDPLFLILPSLLPESLEANAGQTYLSAYDFISGLSECSAHLKALREDNLNIDAIFDNRIASTCDSIDAGDETLYKFNAAKLSEVLLQKSKGVVDGGRFPKSMESKFVGDVLAEPVIISSAEQNTVVEAGEAIEIETQSDSQSTPQDSQSTSQDSQSMSQDSQSQTPITGTSTPATSFSSSVSQGTEQKSRDMDNEHLRHLLQLRTTLTYLLKSYIPSTLHTEIESHLTTSKTIDFEPLTSHLAALSAKKAAAQAHAFADNISRKRRLSDGGEAEALERAEAKKRKKDEEEARKKNVSLGVKKLEKADRSGMKSISSFFMKKT